MTDRLTIITGASRGLGRAFVVHALDARQRCWAIARGRNDLQHQSLKHIPLDLCNTTMVKRWCETQLAPEISAPRARLTLINNAGQLGTMGLDSNYDSAERTYRLNVLTPMELIRTVIRHSGAEQNIIVNISSGAAHKAYPGWLEYCGSKAALSMTSEVIAREFESGMYAPVNHLSVVEYAPGVVNTTMQELIRAATQKNFPAKQRFIDLFARGDLVEPAESARFLFENLDHLAKRTHNRLRYGELM